MGLSGPENKLWFSVDGWAGRFLVSSGQTGLQSAGPCHLYSLATAAFLHLLCSCFICFVFLDSAWGTSVVLDICAGDWVCRRLNNTFVVVRQFA